MGFSKSLFALLLLIAALSMPRTLAATTHIVGGSLAWNIPGNTSAYSDWAANQTFTVGDSLLFNFATGNHDVAQVSKTEYDACTFQNPIGTIWQTGPATVVLGTAGENYFLCTFGTHCSSGQKLAITVAATNGTNTPTTPAAPPPSEAGGSVPPPPSSAAGSASAAVVSFSVFSLVFSYFFYL